MPDFLSFSYDFFLLLKITAEGLMQWFLSPIDTDLAELFGLPLTANNLEVVFVSGIIIALVALVVKLFSPLS